MSWAKSINFAFERDLIRHKALANAAGVTIFTILTALGAYIKIPLIFTPVPITAQTFFVILAGAVLGKRLGTLSQIGYIILGSLGLPIFAGVGYGFSYLAGPTGGYLIGFIICAFLVGNFIEFRKSIWWKIIIFILGLTSIYLCGILWLSLILNISLYKSILLGCIPFIPVAILKIVFALLIYLKFNTRIKKAFLI